MRRIFFAVLILAIGIGAVFSVAHYMNAYDVFHKRITVLENRVYALEQKQRSETQAQQVVFGLMKGRNIFECATFSKKVFGGNVFLRYDDGRASRGTLEYDEHSPKPKPGDRVAVTRTSKGTTLVLVSPELCK
ncbi:MAG: hypothetical protein NUW02_00970 [Candidatus Campbellbacteria bacterium]|nr:hypothetical protein [Candidatus Campbellbacteria bacterium]